MPELVLAIDAGTTGVRSMFFDSEGKIIGWSYEEFESNYPNPSWVEQKASSWWLATCNTIKRAMKDASIAAEYVVGISITNQRETIVPIDENGVALRNAIIWQDRRTVPQCDWIRSVIDPEEVYSITGLTIDPYFSAPKILWINSNSFRTYRMITATILRKELTD